VTVKSPSFSFSLSLSSSSQVLKEPQVLTSESKRSERMEGRSSECSARDEKTCWAQKACQSVEPGAATAVVFRSALGGNPSQQSLALSPGTRRRRKISRFGDFLFPLLEQDCKMDDKNNH
jgi:hypothetical protein